MVVGREEETKGEAAAVAGEERRAVAEEAEGKVRKEPVCVLEACVGCVCGYRECGEDAFQCARDAVLRPLLPCKLVS